MIGVQQTGNRARERTLYIDGTEYVDVVSIFKSSLNESRPYKIRVRDQKLAETLIGHALSEWDSNISEFTLYDIEYKHEFLSRRIDVNFEDAKVIVVLRYTFLVTDWKRPWSVRDFLLEMGRSKNLLKTRTQISPRDGRLRPGYEFLIRCFVEDAKLPLRDIVKSFQADIDRLFTHTQHVLDEKSQGDAVVQRFSFPDEVRVPCEQYLLYFVQFLKDLGVDADARLEHEAGNVLFSVTPTNHKDALDKIREALNVYLLLPTSGLGASYNFEAGIDIQRLTANIQHLNGQLTLARAESQAKDAALQAKEATIQAHNVTIARLTSDNIFLQSSIVKEDEDKEEVLWGVYLTRLKLKGAEIDLPTLFRVFRYHFESTLQKAFPAPPLALPTAKMQTPDVIEGEIVDEA